MPDDKGNLFLFEAVELRNAYDREIDLLAKLLDEPNSRRERLFSRTSDEGEKEPADEFNQKELEESLKKLKTKRLRLNQEIQSANFNVKIEYKGEKISLMQGLEIRKNLLSDLEAISQRVQESAYKMIIHKEERDIVRNPRHSFNSMYAEYQSALRDLRGIINRIHVANHNSVVSFKDE